MSGACNADIADEAVGPEVAKLTGCGRAVEIPVAASALLGGHNPLVGFLRVAQLPASTGAGPIPFVCGAGAGAVIVAVEDAELVEEIDERDDDEFCRWAVFRGPGWNIILVTSSELYPSRLEFHFGWKDKGGATAVI